MIREWPHKNTDVNVCVCVFAVQGSDPTADRSPSGNQTEGFDQLHVSSATATWWGYKPRVCLHFCVWRTCVCFIRTCLKGQESMSDDVQTWHGDGSFNLVPVCVQITSRTATALILLCGRSRDSRGWLWPLILRTRKKKKTTLGRSRSAFCLCLCLSVRKGSVRQSRFLFTFAKTPLTYWLLGLLQSLN